MSDTEPASTGSAGHAATAGEQLRAAREAKGWTLQELASRTRIPQRHLEAIEEHRFNALPASTYAVGFAKAYARQVGLDEVAIAREVRGRVDEMDRPREYVPYQMDDPTRVPSRGLATMAALVAVLIVVGAGIWFAVSHMRGGAPVAPTTTTVADAVPVAPRPVARPVPTPTVNRVVLTATDAVWMRVYDADKKTLFERTMKPGDTFEVPADANNPMINVGRPDKLQVTVNGSAIPPLGDGRRAIKDIGVSAAALRARASGQPAPTATPLASPSGSAAVPAGSGGSAVPPAFAAPGSPNPTATGTPR